MERAQGLFFQRPREAEKRDPGNEVADLAGFLTKDPLPSAVHVSGTLLVESFSYKEVRLLSPPPPGERPLSCCVDRRPGDKC